MNLSNVFAALVAALLALPGASSAEELPPALLATQKQGVVVMGTFVPMTGLKAYGVPAGGQPMSVYLAPNGRVIAGTALDDDGQEADDAAFEATAHPPLGEGAWKQLEASRWIPDGSATAPRIVYIFTDPNCPYCAKLWADARPWVNSGKVQLRHVIVGILTPTSRAKAATLLTERNPAQSLGAYEGLHAPITAKTMSAGDRPRPLGDEGLAPMAHIPAKTAAQLDTNARLMASLGLAATPGVVWRDAAGAIHKRAGAPAASLPDIFGPR